MSHEGRQKFGVKREMVKLLLAVAFILVVLGVTYYQANKQLAVAYGECMIDLNFQARIQHAESEGDIRFLFGQVVGCVDNRKGPLASLVFNREEAVANMEKIYSKGGFKAIEELLRMSADIEDVQSQVDSENNTRAFREGAYGRQDN